MSEFGAMDESASRDRHTPITCFCFPPSTAAHCSEATWHAVLAMAAEIREKNLRIAFFNSTPQVRIGGVGRGGDTSC